MTTTIVANGNTYTDDSNATTGMGNGGWRLRLLRMLSDVIVEVGLKLAAAGSALSASSTTNNVAIGSGTKTLIISNPTTKGFATGIYVVAVDSANSANAMTGLVTSYNATTGALVLSVASGDVAGSGTPAGWTIGLSGKTGPAGGVNTFNGRSGAVTAQTGDYTAAQVGAVGQGLHTISIPAAAMYARTTNGAANGVIETSTNKVMRKTFDFDTATQEYVQFTIAMPKSWDEGTVTFIVYWTAASGSGGVAWALQGLSLSDDDATDTAFGTAVTVTDTFITAGDVHVTATSSAMTLAGTPAVGDLSFFQLSRAVANGSDTLGVDASLLGVKVIYTINAADDT